jgi:type VI secretion system protein VasI
MKKTLTITLLALLPLAAPAQPAAGTTPAGAAPASTTLTLQDCTQIRSSLERLACFDKVAGTPAVIDAGRPAISTSPQHSPIMQLVQNNEANRPAEDSRFIISEAPEPDGGTQVVISAPALGSIPPRPYLTVSCLTNITRLQFVTAQPVQRNVIRVRLLIDGKPIGPQSTWQVMHSGEVVDAGRGLHAIDLVRRLGYGQRLSVESDEELLNGLVFDTTGLAQHINREREACHW